jgi:hypothetical protein
MAGTITRLRPEPVDSVPAHRTTSTVTSVIPPQQAHLRHADPDRAVGDDRDQRLHPAEAVEEHREAQRQTPTTSR